MKPKVFALRFKPENKDDKTEGRIDRIKKVSEPGPGSYNDKEAIVQTQWTRAKYPTRKDAEFMKTKTFVDPVEEIRTRRGVIILGPDLKAEAICVKDHKWGPESDHIRRLHNAPNKISKDKRLIWKRH